VSLARDDTFSDWLKAGDEVRVRFANTRGLSFFAARVLSLGDGDRAELKLESPQRVTSVQRRRFMRLPMRLPFSCTLLDEKGAEAEKWEAYTLELGGNGAGILADRALPVGARVRFGLRLETHGACSGVGVVKRSVLALRPEGAEHRIALQFVEVSSKDQALILSYLLAARRAPRR